MQFSILGSSGLSVSRVCLGSMTWGFQNNQQDANQQIEYALSQGVNFIDTAEMYAVPPSADTYGKTETIIGNWLAANPHRRKDIVLATKISGPGLPWIRNGEPISGDAVVKAVDASLKRLQTNYIDLFQLHWPNRPNPHFSRHKPNNIRFSDINAIEHTAQMLDILQGLQRCVDAGKIRFCGLSDDTTWGINTYLKLSEQHNLPRMVSIQNEFSLLHAKDWPYLIENSVHEDVAYLPWSPLATGMLSGKYLNNVRPEGSRWTFSQRNKLYRNTDSAHLATADYVDIAQQHGYTPAQLALAWCNQVDGVTSTIIGATTLPQLEENISAFSTQLTPQALADISAVFRRYPAPF
ncbi:MAG: aldo/keto reductase [Moritella sp.]|uniref:aldo/keto reductase n=1 Tax=Moritella sp. TaxID=78556 RepID=UPI0029B9C757|nr:aldo/keto reductase [Moritella sp.]MDX2319873.1 aldo/keto reductase [Moritella sp.]